MLRTNTNYVSFVGIWIRWKSRDHDETRWIEIYFVSWSKADKAWAAEIAVLTQLHDLSTRPQSRRRLLIHRVVLW